MRIWPYTVIGALLGVVGCFVPWGKPTGFHGTGIPIPAVMWDLRNGEFIDYPNPLALIENPLIGVLVGFVVWVSVKFIKWGLSLAFRPDEPPPNPVDKPSECVQCHSPIPEGVSKCANCGWSYEINIG
jgi:hypothetical protein